MIRFRGAGTPDRSTPMAMNTIRHHFSNLWDSEDALDSLWRLFSSPYVTVLLLALTIALACLAAFIPQRPVEALSDPAANNVWLNSLRERYGGTADWLLRLRVVDVLRSPWFRGLLSMLALSLMVRAMSFVRPSQLFTPEDGSPTLSREDTAASTIPFIQQATRVLRGNRFRIVPGSNKSVVYADRFIWFPVLVHLGLLLALGGLALSERTAWWENGFVLRPGQVRPLGHGTALAASAQFLQVPDAQQEQGAEEWTELGLFQDGREVRRTILRHRLPTLEAGLLFYRTDADTALLVRAQDATGQTLGLQTPETGVTQYQQVALRFLEDESPRYIVALGLAPGSALARQFQQRGNERYVLVPSRSLTLRLIYHPPDQLKWRPHFEIEVFRADDPVPVYRQEFETSSSVEIDGDRFLFEPQRFAVVTFGQDYGLAVVGLGAVLTLAGVVLSVWRPAQRLCVVAQTTDDGPHLHLTRAPFWSRHTTQWFEDVVQSLAVAMDLTVQSEATA